MTSPTSAAEPVWDAAWVEAFLCCPSCGAGALVRDARGVACPICAHRLELEPPGFLKALAAGEVVDEASADGRFERITQRVRSFYEAHPFPNYDGFESLGDLLARASRSIYGAALDRQIPAGARVLEVGCGTGQLGAFLSIGGRPVVGVDITRASLAMAAEFKQRLGLHNLNLLQASLFDMPLRAESFDLIVCKGVLHHTPDPRGGFRRLCRLLRPGGYLIVGLYNRVARLPTSWRRWWFRLTGANLRSGDYVLKKLGRSDDKALSWFLDQYAHPHESRHTIDEVLGWFRAEGIDYTSAVPPLQLGEPFDPTRALFAPRDPRGRLEHWLVQLSWILSISREGALFDVIGRKRESA